MQASPISPAAASLAVPAANVGAPSTGEPDAFDKVLTREVAERGSGQDKPAAEARSDESKPAEAPSSAETPDDTAAADDPTHEAASAASAEMLALVASIAHFQGGAAEVRSGREGSSDDGLSAGRRRPAQLGALNTTGPGAGGLEAEADDATRGDLAATRLDAKTHAALPALQNGAGSTAKTGAAAAANDFNATLREVGQLLQPMQQPAATHAAASQAADKLAARVGSPDWDQALGQKIVWMVNGDQQSASLELNPPELGPLKVVLQVSNAHANATFVAAQPEVRQALEAAMPKLRDMLGDAGIQLGQASVDSGAQQQQQQAAGQSMGRGAMGAGNTTATEALAPAPPLRMRPDAVGHGLVDTFA